MTNKKTMLWHPVHSSEDGVFNTASGVRIDLNHPIPEMFNIQDIAGALSNICRFGGHSSAFYSVAQHSVIVANMAPVHLKKEALMHDAAEAYLGDVISPLKYELGLKYTMIEDAFNCAIAKRFKLACLDGEPYRIIKKLDMEVLAIEHQALLQGDFEPWTKLLNKYNLLDLDTNIWYPELAKTLFITHYNLYFLPKKR